MAEPFIRSLVLDRSAIAPHVTFLAGANAAGKSTLIEAIAVALGLNPEGQQRGLGNNATTGSGPQHSGQTPLLQG